MKKVFKFKSDIQNLVKAENIVENLSKHLDLSQEEYVNILVCLSEAINNAITHGNKMDSNKYVKVYCSINKDTVELAVEDEGDGFNPDEIPDPTAPENIEKETGRGIFIIRNLSDEVRFEKNGSKIIMKFKIKNKDDGS